MLKYSACSKQPREREKAGTLAYFRGEKAAGLRKMLSWWTR